jgi:hypothetical protein
MRELADFYFQSHKPMKLYVYNMILIRTKRTDIYIILLTFTKRQKIVEKLNRYSSMISMIRRFYAIKSGAIFATVGKKDEARKIWLEILNKYPNNPLKNLISESLNQIK